MGALYAFTLAHCKKYVHIKNSVKNSQNGQFTFSKLVAKYFKFLKTCFYHSKMNFTFSNIARNPICEV